MADASQSLNSGPVGRQLARNSAPLSLGILGVLAIGLSDAFFLARAGEAELAAIGFVFPVITAISALSLGLSTGTTTALSQALGAGRPNREVQRLNLHACTLGLALGVCAAGLLWLTGPALFAALGAKGEVSDHIRTYLPYWAVSFPPLVVTMAVEAGLRARGRAAAAAGTMALTAVLNIAATPVLVFGLGPAPEMGMAGAGLGTLLARASVAMLAVALALRTGVLAARCGALGGFGQSVRAIVPISLPAALARAIDPAGMALVTAAVATLGDTAVAGFAAATRVQSLALVPVLAVANGLGPVVGQAWGAGNAGRAQAGLRAATLFCLGYGVGLGGALFLFGEDLAEIMTARGAAAGYAADYLRLVGWSLAGYGVMLSVGAALTARSRAAWAMGLSLSRIALIYVPCAWIGVTVLGYHGILAAAVAANLGVLVGVQVALRSAGLRAGAETPTAPASG